MRYTTLAQKYKVEIDKVRAVSYTHLYKTMHT